MSWSQWAEQEGGAARAVLNRLEDRLRDSLLGPSPAKEAVRSRVERLLDAGGAQTRAILFYGSCLFAPTRTQSSFPDFYLLVDDLNAYHESLLHALLNRLLPPNVYSTGFRNGLACKYCVMSMRQFRRETSPRARDLHHLGRFSKQIALSYVRDAATTDEVLSGHLEAMLTLVPHCLALLPPSFDLETFLLQQLGLSYLGEQRVIEPSKVSGLLRGARQFYQEIYADVLELFELRRGLPRREGGIYRQPAPSCGQRHRTRWFLRRSRARGMLRWPKYVVTFDSWVDYLLEKLERHHGVRVVLTEHQRRHPLLFGWPIYMEMRRRGIVR